MIDIDDDDEEPSDKVIPAPLRRKSSTLKPPSPRRSVRYWMSGLNRLRRRQSSQIYAIERETIDDSPYGSPKAPPTTNWQSSESDPTGSMDITKSTQAPIRNLPRGVALDGAEYVEVVIPVLYAIVLGGEWLLPNAQYNVVVNTMTGTQAWKQVWISLVYALLEVASMLTMYWIMKRKYGASAFYQLAFVLDKYWMTLKGKLVGAFICVMNAVTLHQGAGAFVKSI